MAVAPRRARSLSSAGLRIRNDPDIIDDGISQEELLPRGFDRGVFCGRFNSLRIRVNNRLEQNVIFDMRREVYGRLQRLPVPWFDPRASGDLMTRVIEDVNRGAMLIDGVEQGTWRC
jgi:hypothetical protein